MRFSPRATDDHSLAPFQLANGIGFGTCDPILDHVVGIILVLSEIIPRCALDLFRSTANRSLHGFISTINNLIETLKDGQEGLNKPLKVSRVRN
jgi:hypothetical protein